MAAVDAIDTYLDELPGTSRRLAHGEWGVTLDADHAAGWPLDVGIVVTEGMVRAQAHALTSPDEIDPWMLLWWNRQTTMARFSCTLEREIWVHAELPAVAVDEREIWVHAELPAVAVDEREIDRLLGLVVEGAIGIREFQHAKRNPRPVESGWLDGAA